MDSSLRSEAPASAHVSRRVSNMPENVVFEDDDVAVDAAPSPLCYSPHEVQDYVSGGEGVCDRPAAHMGQPFGFTILTLN